MRFMLMVLVFMCCAGLRAADAPAAPQTQDEEGKKKTAALIKDLGADSFDARNNAEKELAALMPAAMTLIKEALAGAKDAEVKSRLEKVLKASALEHVDDPELLAKYGKEEAQAKRFETAAKFYEKAAKLYAQKAAKAEVAETKKELETKAELASTRQKRARILAKSGGGPKVVIQGGGGDAGGMVVISTVEVSDDSGAGVDLKSEDW